MPVQNSCAAAQIEVKVAPEPKTKWDVGTFTHRVVVRVPLCFLGQFRSGGLELDLLPGGEFAVHAKS